MVKNKIAIMPFDVNQNEYRFWRWKGYSKESFQLHPIRIFNNNLEPIYQQKVHAKKILSYCLPTAIDNLARHFKSVEKCSSRYSSEEIGCMIHGKVHENLNIIKDHVTNHSTLSGGVNLTIEWVLSHMKVLDIPVNLNNFNQVIEIMRHPIKTKNFDIMKKVMVMKDE